MTRPPGTFGGVCDTPLHEPDKYLLNTYLLNPIAGKDGIHPWIDLPILDKFSTGRVGAYGIRPTNTYDNGLMNHPPGTFGVVCHTSLP